MLEECLICYGECSRASTTSQPRGTTTKKSQIRITSDTYYTSLFSTLQSLGHAHTSLSDYALARDACSESLQLAWEMALSTSKAHSENEALAISVTRVMRALKRLGKTYLLEKHYAPALECFLPSLELLRSSKEMESTLDCASVLGSLGFLYLKLKKYTESSNFLRECLRLYHENGVFQEGSCRWMHQSMSSFRPMSSFLIKIALSLKRIGFQRQNPERETWRPL